MIDQELFAPISDYWSIWSGDVCTNVCDPLHGPRDCFLLLPPCPTAPGASSIEMVYSSRFAVCQLPTVKRQGPQAPKIAGIHFAKYKDMGGSINGAYPFSWHFHVFSMVNQPFLAIPMTMETPRTMMSGYPQRLNPRWRCQKVLPQRPAVLRRSQEFGCRWA